MNRFSRLLVLSLSLSTSHCLAAMPDAAGVGPAKPASSASPSERFIQESIQSIEQMLSRARSTHLKDKSPDETKGVICELLQRELTFSYVHEIRLASKEKRLVHGSFDYSDAHNQHQDNLLLLRGHGFREVAGAVSESEGRWALQTAANILTEVNRAFHGAKMNDDAIMKMSLAGELNNVLTAERTKIIAGQSPGMIANNILIQALKEVYASQR